MYSEEPRYQNLVKTGTSKVCMLLNWLCLLKWLSLLIKMLKKVALKNATLFVHLIASGVYILVFACVCVRSLYANTPLHLSLSMRHSEHRPKTADYPNFIAPQGGPIPVKNVISGAKRDIFDYFTELLYIDRKASSQSKTLPKSCKMEFTFKSFFVSYSTDFTSG